MIKRIAVVAFVLAVLAAIGSEVALAAKYHSTAKLHGYSGMKAKVDFESKSKNGKAYKRMVVKASNGLPLHSYGVYVNGKKVGQFTANMAGKGKLDLRAGYKKSGDSKKMPKWMNKLKKGDVVTVGSCCGVVFDCGQNGTQKYKVAGDASGDLGEQVNVSYCEKFSGTELDRRFIVEVSNAPVDVSYDVFVNGNFVGTIVADETGAGKLELRTAAFIPDGSSAQAMPDDFPTLQAGNEVTVGGIVVSLSQITGGNVPPGGDDDSSDDDSNSSDDDSGSDDDSSSDNGSNDDGSGDNSGPGGGGG
jgi:hypothetical protein